MRRLFTVLVLVGALVTAATAVAPSALAGSGSTNTSAQLAYTSSTVSLANLGTVNLATAASAPLPPTGSSSHAHPAATPLGSPPRAGTKGKPISRGSFSVLKGNVAGEIGFDGITGPEQAAVNGGVNVGDLEPPDQGTCAGPDANGTPIAMEIVNNALAAYTTSGTQELGVTPTYALFNQPSTAFLSDPRCYYDSSTQRWFFTEFVFTNPATQFIAVSQSSDPFGKYKVFGFDTTDAKNPLGDCPCYGDFDQIGADANGFYIATNEFPDVSTFPYFNGTVMYAMSKQGLESAADGGSLPSVARYQITGDAFGSGNGSAPYHVSPASTPPGGGYAPNTEYFVESNSNAFSDNHLIVYALTGTDALATGGIPPLKATEIESEAYAFPPNATQKPGPIPYGNSVGATTPGTIQADFNAVQEVTYTDGTLYAELDTAAGSPTPTDAAAWFSLAPSLSATGVSVQLIKQGYVGNSQNLLYPDIVVDASGNGFLVFSISGPAEYPSPAYVAFHANAGPTGTVHIANAGSAPEDGFTCYIVGYGGCRWGDYSGGAVWGGRVYMMAEYIPATPRDILTNWGTYVWSAPTH